MLSVNNRGETPLYRAARKGHANIVEPLLEAGAIVNVRDNRGRTPLALAELRNNIDAVNVLEAWIAEHPDD